MEDDRKPEEAEGTPLSRKKFIAGAGAAGAGIVLGSVPGVAAARSWSSQSRNKALATGLAPGMIGGPVGFKGAERYQYPANSEEGRAHLAAKALRKAGKAPDTLVVQVLNFARPQFENRFPKGASGSIVELWEKATGIKIKFVETNPASENADNVRNASTKNSSFDLVTGAIEDTGDYAEAGLLRPLDDYVAKYKPSWNDPKYGYLGGRPTVAALHPVQRPHLLGCVRQRHPAVRLPLGSLQQQEGEGSVRGQVRAAAGTCRRHGTTRRRSPSSSPGRRREAPVRLGRAQEPVLGHRQLGAPLRVLGRPEHVLLQARRLGERQQHGRHPRGQEHLRSLSGRSRVRSRRTGSRSTRPSVPATASRAGRSRT